MDDNDDGGNGSGLYIDDVRIVQDQRNESIPVVDNVTAVAMNDMIQVNWDMPPVGFDNDVVYYDDGSFEDDVWMSSGTAMMGTYFTMPFGSNSVSVGSASVYGVPDASGSTILSGYSIVDGAPLDSASFQTNITTQDGEWTDVELGWTFSGDYLLAIEITTSIGVAIDTDNTPSEHSWIHLGESWYTWYNTAIEYGLSDGEFGIRAIDVTSTGETSYEPTFNVYRNDNGGSYYLLSSGLFENEYLDYDVISEVEYCYSVTTVIDYSESFPTLPVCATLGALEAGEASITLDNVYGLPGDTVVVSVNIEMENNYSITSYEMTISGYADHPVEFLGIDTTGTLTSQLGWMVYSNEQDSEALISAAGGVELTYGGTLLRLRFAIDLDAGPAEIPIVADDVLLNEDYVITEINPGSIVIPEGCTENFVAIFCDYGNFQSEVSWILFNSEDDTVAAGGAPHLAEGLCLLSDVYTLVMYDSYGDGWNGNMWEIYDYISGSTVISLTLESGSQGSEIFLLGDAEHIMGCMDPDAINYNADATQDDGSCLYNGDLCSVAIETVDGDAGNQADGNDEWFYYTATMDGYINITTCYDGQPEDTDILIYSSCPEDDGYVIDGNDDAYCGDVTGGNDFASDITIGVTEGETYFIFWNDTWDPGPFTWYLYESPPQSGPDSLEATAGSGQVFLEWNPVSPVLNSRENSGPIISENTGSILDEFVDHPYAKKQAGAERGYRGRSRGSLMEEIANNGTQNQDRNIDVIITLFDSYGDGHYGGDSDGDAYLMTYEGDTLATLEGNWAGHQ